MSSKELLSMNRERNATLTRLVESLDRARVRTYIACAQMTLIVLRELREHLQRGKHPAYASEDSIQRTEHTLEALVALLSEHADAERGAKHSDPCAGLCRLTHADYGPPRTAHLVTACGCYLAAETHSVLTRVHDGDWDDVVASHPVDVLTRDPNRARVYATGDAAMHALALRKDGALRGPVVHDPACPNAGGPPGKLAVLR